MHLVVEDFGVSLGKKSERLLIRQKGQVISETPFRDIEQITIASKGVSLSSDVIQECTEYGIQINFLSFSGKPYAKLASPNLTGTVETRRQQILAYLDERGVTLAKAFVDGKLKNQANVLKYFAKYRRTTDAARFSEISGLLGIIDRLRGELAALHAPAIEQIRGQILAIEGRAAQHYWEGLKLLLDGGIEFDGRERRGATDPVNSALNYGYGILYSQVWGAVTLAGLDPFAGFLHTDRPGKVSLVLDLIEEFRPVAVDRVVVAMINKGTKIEMEEDRLADETRRELGRRITERLNAEESYEGKKHKLKFIIQKQARSIATFLRGEGKYRPFSGSW
ncbi:MAG: CRISPR-associated endonuclease Cas1 [Thermoanaerobacterales bacterium]|nr:CRISPR-associated endonuclease Cas1 [Thermoanaerobacterales bacterium]